MPALKTPEAEPLGDSLAIAEILAERHPEAGLWPADPAARMRPRWLAAEMHSGFAALRGDCPMNLTCAYTGFPASDAVTADLARLKQIQAAGRARFGGAGPWLLGGYCLADVFFAPVAARIAGYGLAVGPEAQAYVASHLADPAFRRWRAEGLTVRIDSETYGRNLPTAPWPGPTPLAARAVDKGPSANAACPYSGGPVSHFLEIGGRVFGFCNPTCRDKTANDPTAFPAFMAIYQS